MQKLRHENIEIEKKQNRTPARNAALAIGAAGVLGMFSCADKVAAPQPTAYTCPTGIQTQDRTIGYNNDVGSTQFISTDRCGTTIAKETATFSPALATPLPEGKYMVGVLDTGYVLAGLSTTGIILGKEAVTGIVNQGESFPIDNLKFQLDDLSLTNGVKTAIISILDANDNVIKKDLVTVGSTKEYVIDGKTYYFRVYQVAPGYTFGAKWAEAGIFTSVKTVSDGGQLTDSDGTYALKLNVSGTTVTGWEFQRTQ